MEASVVTTVFSGFEEDTRTSEIVSAAQVNQRVAELLAVSFNDTVIVETPGWGVRIFAHTHFGDMHAGGNTEQEAENNLMRVFDTYEYEHNLCAAEAMREYKALHGLS